MQNTNTINNYTLFIDTVKSLSSSQGFYSRLWQQIQQTDPDELEEYFNNLDTTFQDSLDVILWLEG